MAKQKLKIANERLAGVFMINQNVSLRTVALLDRAMDNEPDVRYQTGEDVVAAVFAAAGRSGPFTADSAAGGVVFLL